MVDVTVLQALWFGLIAVLWIGYLVLEGFDYGVAMLIPFLGRNDKERRVMVNTVGPVWDGNEVWLITAGGATFAAFPAWYATLFSGLYLPLFLVLFGLIIRGVSFEYRSKHPDSKWRRSFDWMAATGSFFVSLVFGVAFANFILGLVCILLVVLVLSQWLANRRAALAEMQDEVQAMRARATQSEQLRAQLTGALAASKFLVKRKSENPSALAVLDDLTRRLPATAWLDVLTLDDQGGLDIKGEAAKAAALVDTLGSSKLLQEPKLQGVIQPDPATGKERFEMVARIRQQGAADGH